LRPETATIGIASVLNRSSPRAIAARPASRALCRCDHAAYSVNTIGLKFGLLPVQVVAVGSHPSGSLPPNVNVRSDRISGPPCAPAMCRSPAERSMSWAV